MHSLACSDAFIGDVDSPDPSTQLWGKDGEFDEYPQIQAGYLDSMTQLNAWADDLDSIQDAAAPAAVEATVPASDMVYDDTDVNAVFNGYRLCDGTEGINAVVLGQAGPGDFSCSPSTVLSTWCVSRESFHPNDIGTQRYADVFQKALGESGTDATTDMLRSGLARPRPGP
jgi:hypothetical protein